MRIKRKRRSGGVEDLPFLHGGSSKDPLNLNAVKPADEAELEAEIMKPVEIIIPKNIHDPLNLLRVNKNRKKRFVGEVH